MMIKDFRSNGRYSIKRNHVKAWNLLLLPILLFLFSNGAYAESNNEIICPKAEELTASVEQEKEELTKALSDYLVKSTYGKSHKTWTVEVMSPLKDLKRTDASYYHMAIQKCGRNVADRSFFVRLRFTSSSQFNQMGEFFVSKDSNQKWKIWFRYV
ncbi:hypothetical protein [Ectobacillus polymachus]|uniref:hypothetical protein n=1 Tax=Ectobacillus polymachus TaxID=1508806 RepID=UPI003A8629F3